MCPPGKIKSKMKINKDENKSKEKKVKVLYGGTGRRSQQPSYLLLSKSTEQSDLYILERNPFRSHLVHSPISHLLIN